MFRDKVHAASGRISRYQLGDFDVVRYRFRTRMRDLPELAIHMAMQDPMSQHQTAVAGPPAPMGMLKVAGTEPRTPRMEMA